MTDEQGPDAKIICVPTQDAKWGQVFDLYQLPSGLTNEIRHFFDIYKDLEPGKQTSVKGYEGRESAWFEIVASRQRVRRGET